MKNSFTWCDLSTYDLAIASPFYQNVMGWSAYGSGGFAREDDYTLFYAGSESSAAIYTMPEFFQNINMPSFWMSYVRVEGLASVVEKSVKLGAKCEVEPTPLDENSQFALIRDPSGAGFTLYEGPDLMGRDQLGTPGRMVWNELHVPSLDLVASFYCNLFDWAIAQDQTIPNRHNIFSSTGDALASILELGEQTKGPKNYWAVIFGTLDLDATLEAVTSNGGSILMRPNPGLDYAMVTDNQDAMFCVMDVSGE